MPNHASHSSGATASLLIASLVAVSVLVPVLANPGEAPQETSEADRVARKLAKARGTAHAAEEEREALRHFQEEVAEYADLHTKQAAKLGSRGGESAAAQKALAHGIVGKREKAKPGDLFRPHVQPLFRRLIAEQLKGPDSLDARKAVLDGNPTNEEDSVLVVLRVNAVYPVGAPRSTVPPSLLLTLPALPESLHYRFVGRDLVLLDSVAQIIVDFLPAAAPELAAK